MVRIHNPHKSSKVLEMIFLLIGDPIVEGPVNMPKAVVLKLVPPFG